MFVYLESEMLRSDKQCSPNTPAGLEIANPTGTRRGAFHSGLAQEKNPKEICCVSGRVCLEETLNARQNDEWNLNELADKTAELDPCWTYAHTCSCNITLFIIVTMIKSTSLTMRREEGGEGEAEGSCHPGSWLRAESERSERR